MEDDELQAWLDEQDPVIDHEHVRNMRKLQRQLRPVRSFEEQRRDFQYELKVQAYAKAINANIG